MNVKKWVNTAQDLFYRVVLAFGEEQGLPDEISTGLGKSQEKPCQRTGIQTECHWGWSANPQEGLRMTGPYPQQECGSESTSLIHPALPPCEPDHRSPGEVESACSLHAAASKNEF